MPSVGGDAQYPELSDAINWGVYMNKLVPITLENYLAIFMNVEHRPIL